MEKILVVDDDEKIREMLTDILTDKGYSVKSVGTSKEAIEASNDQLFNLVLIDIHLPDMEGTELLTRLRKTEPEMVKIIITGNATLENSIEAANKGIDGYVVKPFDPKKLVKLIETKLNEQLGRMQFDDKKLAEYIELRHGWMAATRKK